MKITYFKNQKDFRKWLAKNHLKEMELWVGYHKINSGLPSLTWPESVEEALCFGWIDGIRKSVDDLSYVIRFTPRKPKSIWSAKNISTIRELIRQERVFPAGLDAFMRLEEKRSNVYSFEQRIVQLSREFERMFRKNKNAWNFFQSQVPSYRKPAIHWVMSAKQEMTRLKRLNILINDSAQGRKIASLRRNDS
jgi:uncharacterized protein YdeI (YjbR/CyaY-like superfamily)